MALRHRDVNDVLSFLLCFIFVVVLGTIDFDVVASLFLLLIILLLSFGFGVVLLAELLSLLIPLPSLIFGVVTFLGRPRFFSGSFDFDLKIIC